MCVKLLERRAAAERVRLSAGLPGQKAAHRLGKEQSEWLCSALFGLTSDRKTPHVQGRLHQSPPPLSTKLHFSRAGSCVSGHTISHQLEGHLKTRQESTCAHFCTIQGAQQRAQEDKRACLGVLCDKHAESLPGKAILQQWCGKG